MDEPQITSRPSAIFNRAGNIYTPGREPLAGTTIRNTSFSFNTLTIRFAVLLGMPLVCSMELNYVRVRQSRIFESMIQCLSTPPFYDVLFP